MGSNTNYWGEIYPFLHVTPQILKSHRLFYLLFHQPQQRRKQKNRRCYSNSPLLIDPLIFPVTSSGTWVGKSTGWQLASRTAPLLTYSWTVSNKIHRHHSVTKLHFSNIHIDVHHIHIIATFVHCKTNKWHRLEEKDILLIHKPYPVRYCFPDWWWERMNERSVMLFFRIYLSSMRSVLFQFWDLWNSCGKILHCAQVFDEE